MADHLSVTNITYNSATTHCEVKGQSYHWQVRAYGSYGAWKDYEGTSAHPVWKDLHYGTKYEYKVKVKCHSGHWTSWSPTKWFTTEDHYGYCSTPLSQHLSVTNITYNSATTHCEIKGQSYHWQVRAYGSYGAWKDYQGTSAHPVWKDLHYGTKYEYKVKVKCHSGYWTSWSPSKWFTTEDHYYDNCTTPQSHHMSAKDISYNSASTHCSVSGADYHWYIRPYGSYTWVDYYGHSNQHSWNNLKYGTKYEYKVKIKCHSGQWSGWSPIMHFTTHDHHYGNSCSAPGSYDFTAIHEEYDLFRIYNYTAFKTWTSAIRVVGMDWSQHTTSANNMAWGNLMPNTEYQYRIRRECHDGSISDWSQIKSFWTGTTGRPASSGPIAVELGAEDAFKASVSRVGETVVYPSPASDYFTIEGDIQVGSELRIMNLQGQLIHRHVVENNMDRVNVQALESGYYQILVSRADGTIESKKLIVMH